MSSLEEEGFITRFHPSSGGVPLEKGYRYYLETSLPEETLAPEVKRSLWLRLQEREQDMEQWLDEAAEILAGLASNIAIVTGPRFTESRLRHLELVHLQGYLVLLVIVFQGAVLRKEVLAADEPVNQDQLAAVANRLNASLTGLTMAEIQESAPERSVFESRIRDRVLQVLQRLDQERNGDLFLHGLRHLLRQPEFSTGDRFQAAVEVLEDRDLLVKVFSQWEAAEVAVLIGNENPLQILHPFSLVVSRYGHPGGPTGALGVIGPTRMQYHQTMAAVELVSALVGRLLEETHGG
jgi:heat-inducible transcriptional repressor